MRVLWISSLAWKKDKYPYPVDGPGSVSSSIFVQSMIEGLEEQGAIVDIIADYPYGDGCAHEEWRSSHSEHSADTYIASNTNLYINKMLKPQRLGRAIDRLNPAIKYDYIVGYLIHSPYMKGMKKAKQRYPDAKLVLICPDLPDMMDMSLAKKPIKRTLKYLDGLQIKKLYRWMDGYVLFSKYMVEKIPTEGKPVITIEGVATIDELNTEPVQKERLIMHAGTLHKNIGIEQIIEAMTLLRDLDLRLWIFGDGELRPYIEQKAAENSNIEYKGFVDRNILFAYQKKALAMINARNPKDDFTRYSFPSKVFEYLYSGTPFITTVLSGVPEEYRKFLIEIADNSPKVIAETVRKVVENVAQYNDSYQDSVRAFISTQKNKSVQGKKLYEFLLDLNQ